MNDETDQTIKQLVARLKSGDQVESWKAGLALRALGSAAVEPLINLFKEVKISRNAFSRNAGLLTDIANNLRELGNVALDGVLLALNDPDEKIRFGAVFTLGYSYDVKLNEPSEKSQARVTYTQRYAKPLGLLDPNRVTSALVRTLQDKVVAVRSEAAKSLGIVGNVNEATPALVETLLHNTDSQIRSDAANALHDLMDVATVEPLIQALADDDKWVRYSVIRALDRLRDERAFGPISQFLRHEVDKDVVEMATTALVDINEDLAAPVLIEALKSSEAVIRAAAALAIRDIDNTEARDLAVPSLVELVENDPDQRVRENAMYALSEGADASVLAPLLEALKDEDAGIRGSAAFALGQLGFEEAITDLAQLLLSDPSTSVRRDSAMALGEFDNEQVIESLLKALTDEDKYVRGYAADSLKNYDNPVVVNSLVQLLAKDVTEVVRMYAVQSLRELAAPIAVPSLINVLQHDQFDDVRNLAASALGVIGDPVSIEPLLESLKSDTSPHVRSQAAAALSRIRDAKTPDLGQ